MLGKSEQRLSMHQLKVWVMTRLEIWVFLAIGI